MSKRIKEAIDEFVKLSGPISEYARDVDPWTHAKGELEDALAGDPLEATGVERLCAAVDLMVGRGLLDARTPVGDARLDLGEPHDVECALETLAEPRTHLEKQRADATFLRDSGLLFEVNRRVLHPLGLALAVVVDGDTLDPLRIAPDLLRTDDREGIVFSDVQLESGLRVLRTYMKTEGYERLAARYAALGYRGQVPEDSDPNVDEADWTPARRQLTALARDVVEAAEALIEDLEHPRFVVMVENGRISEEDAERLNEMCAKMEEGVDEEALKAECRRLSTGDKSVTTRRISPSVEVDDLRRALYALRMREAAESTGPDPDPEVVEAVERAISTGFGEERLPVGIRVEEAGRNAYRHIVRILKVEDLGNGEGRATVGLLATGGEATLGFDADSTVAAALVDNCLVNRNLKGEGTSTEIVVAGNRRIVGVL